MDTKTAREHTVSVSLDIDRVIRILDMWSRNYATRRELRNLDDHQLADIGLDRISAQRESDKPFWQN